MTCISLPTVLRARILAILVLLVLIRPSLSEAIQITGGSAEAGFLSGPGGLIAASLTGSDGFFLQATRSATGSADQCFTIEIEFRMVDARCRPGDPVTLSATWLGGPTSVSFGDFATLRGISYDTGPFPCGVGLPCLPIADVEGTFTAFTILAPSLDIGPTFSVEGPFVFTGTFTYADDSTPGGGSKMETVTGRGRATLRLGQGHFLPDDEPLWLLGGVTYEFLAPTPEPTTLLLWGTTVAGIGAAGWVRRRRSEKRELW